MLSMKWSETKQKGNEQYSNSIDFVYCLKHHLKEKKVEVWKDNNCYVYYAKTTKEAFLMYRNIRLLPEKNIHSYLCLHFIKIPRNRNELIQEKIDNVVQIFAMSFNWSLW